MATTQPRTRQAGGSYKPVNAALRVLDVLFAVNALDGRATVGTLHQRTGLNKPTIVRMLETLMAAGYVVHDHDRQTYLITGKTISLSSSFDKPREIARLSAPLLGRFREEIGWPSDIAVFDTDAMLVIGSSREMGPLSFNRAPGYRAPVLATSLGLCFSAHCDADTFERLIQRVLAGPPPWNALARDRAALDARLARIRRDGFAEMDAAYSQSEYGNRVSSVGVPVLGQHKVYAAMNLIYFKKTLDRETVLRDLAPRLRAFADELGTLFDAQALELGEARRDRPPAADAADSAHMPDSAAG